jgi:hypothetical protein
MQRFYQSIIYEESSDGSNSLPFGDEEEGHINLFPMDMRHVAMLVPHVLADYLTRHVQHFPYGTYLLTIFNTLLSSIR